MLGTCRLAITAYNHGRGGMLRAKKIHGSDLPNVINEVLRTGVWIRLDELLCRVPGRRGGLRTPTGIFQSLELDRPLGPTPVKALMAKAGVARRPATNAAGSSHAASKTTSCRRRGDTLADIARRFGTSIRHLMTRNQLGSHAIMPARFSW